MHTAECRMAIQQLMTYLENPELHQTELNIAISHISHCPYCEHRIGHLVRALKMDEEDSLTCHECEEQLPDYFQAQMEGEADSARWYSVTNHLETCPHCSAAYVLLSDLTALAYGERGVEPPDYPEPDLSFLRDKEPIPLPIPWRLDELGHLIIEFSTELVRAFQPPSYAAKLKSAKKTLYELSLPDAVDDLELTIKAETQRDDPAHCTVTVDVNIPSRGGWPNLADTKVTLKPPDLEPETRLTDPFGQAVFKGIVVDDLPELVFEIMPPG